MSKKEDYKRDLAQLFDAFLQTDDEKKLIAYLVSQSNLPGRRANLEYAYAFAEVVKERYAKEPEKLWQLCLDLILFAADEAPVNDPKEFLPFCGACALGAVGSVSAPYFQEALSRLKELAADPRWRIRESVAMGIQKMIEKERHKTLNELESWILNGNWLAMRAVAAGVAEPALLRDTQTARTALALHKMIFDRIRTACDRKSEAFKTLQKGLGYSLSVVISATPKEGFEYLYQLIDSQDPDIRWIVKENLKKNRLIKHFPDEVAALKALLQ